MAKGQLSGRVIRVEAAASLALLIGIYATLDARWLLFALLFFAPDLSAVALIGGYTVGAAAYNAAHTTLGPALLALAALGAGWPTVLAVAVIWGAHIAFDRAIGYGLRTPQTMGGERAMASDSPESVARPLSDHPASVRSPREDQAR